MPPEDPPPTVPRSSAPSPADTDPNMPAMTPQREFALIVGNLLSAALDPLMAEIASLKRNLDLLSGQVSSWRSAHEARIEELERTYRDHERRLAAIEKTLDAAE